MARAAPLVWFVGWLLTAVLLAVGGAAYIVAVQWLAQAILGLIGAGRLVSDISLAGTALGVAVAAASVVSLIVLGIFGQRGRRRLGIIAVWLVAYLLLWLLGLALRGISLPVFTAVLTGVGLLAGWLFAPATGSPARQPANAPRRATPSAVADSRQFGRVPAATVLLLTQHARQIRGAVAGALSGTPAEVRDATAGAVLDRTLRDWWENGNGDGLTPRDLDDLKSFVALAAALAGGVGALATPEQRAIYRATLAALLDDWLANWNAGGVDGPPTRR